MNRNLLLPLTILISMIATGLFTGLMCCFLIAVDPMLSELNGSSYAIVMQSLIQHADHPPLVPLMVVVSLISPLLALWFLRNEKATFAFRATLLGWLLFVVVLYITIVLNVPINHYISSWNVRQLPPDWAANRAHWHQLNLFRTPASAAAFLCHCLAALAVRRSPATATIA